MCQYAILRIIPTSKKICEKKKVLLNVDIDLLPWHTERGTFLVEQFANLNIGATGGS
jgi:hypothetical protein